MIDYSRHAQGGVTTHKNDYDESAATCVVSSAVSETVTPKHNVSSRKKRDKSKINTDLDLKYGELEQERPLGGAGRQVLEVEEESKDFSKSQASQLPAPKQGY